MIFIQTSFKQNNRQAPGTFRHRSVLTFAVICALCLAPSFSAGAAHAFTRQADASIYQVPDTIPADCSVDVTEALNLWIAGVPDGSILSFNPGCYRVDGTIRIDQRHNLTFEGNSALFKAFVTPTIDSRSSRKHWFITASTGIVLRNLRVMGTNVGISTTHTVGGAKGCSTSTPTDAPTVTAQSTLTMVLTSTLTVPLPPWRELCDGVLEFSYGWYDANHESEHGVDIKESNNIRVENVEVHHVFGDGLYIGAGRVPAKNVIVSNFTVTYNGRHGLAVTNAENVLLDNVRVLNSRRAAVDLEPPGSNHNVRGLEIRNSHFNSRHASVAALGRGDVSDIYFHHNVIIYSASKWIHAVAHPANHRKHNWRVEHNTWERPGNGVSYSLHFERVDNIHVIGNYSPRETDRQRVALLLDDVGGEIVIANNDFTGACRLYDIEDTTVPVAPENNILADDCILDVEPNPTKQPAPETENPVLIWDSFSDTDGLNVLFHQPDVDLLGKGWQPVKVRPDLNREPKGTIFNKTMRLLESNSGFVLDTGQSDVIVQTEWHPMGGANNDNAIILRYETDGDMWAVRIQGTEQRLSFGRLGKRGKTYAGTTYHWEADKIYTIQVEVHGPSVTVAVNDVQQLQYEHQDFNGLATKFGMLRWKDGDHNAEFDNFLVTSIAADDASATKEPVYPGEHSFSVHLPQIIN